MSSVLAALQTRVISPCHIPDDSLSSFKLERSWVIAPESPAVDVNPPTDKRSTDVRTDKQYIQYEVLDADWWKERTDVR